MQRGMTRLEIQRLKVKGRSIYIPPLTLNDQQWFTVQSGVLKSQNWHIMRTRDRLDKELAQECTEGWRS